MSVVYKTFLYAIQLMAITVLTAASAAFAAEDKIAELIDPAATTETKQLWQLLHKSRQRMILMGQQQADYEGFGWRMEAGRCDILTSCGDWPAVIGYGLHNYQKSDKARHYIRQRMLECARRGGIIELSWHPDNPLTGGRYSDRTPDSIKQVLPGGRAHDKLISWLDDIADLILSLKDDSGRPIAVLFRPWHEHTGGWFWWGTQCGSDEEYIQLWRMTVEHLRDKRQVHQIIWVLSPSAGDLLKKPYEQNRFPGLQWVDVLGLDHYSSKDEHLKRLGDQILAAAKLAKRSGKLFAVTELGYSNGLSKYNGDDWWAGKLLPILKDRNLPHPAWILTWRNGGPDHYWVPIGDMRGAQDFRDFCDDPLIAMEADLVKFRQQLKAASKLPQ